MVDQLLLALVSLHLGDKLTQKTENAQSKITSLTIQWHSWA